MNLKEKKIKSNKVYSGKFIDLYCDDVLCPNGNESKREYVVHPGASCILATIDNKIILEKQYRYPIDKVIYELPAGKLDHLETPRDCAIRELEEETGYLANKIDSLGYIYSSSGFSNEVIYLFHASELVKTKTNFDQDEMVELEFFSIDEIDRMIKEHKIVDSKTICAIHLFKNK